MAARLEKLRNADYIKMDAAELAGKAEPGIKQEYASVTCRNFNNEYLDEICALEDRIYPHGWSRALIASEFEKKISIRRALFGSPSVKRSSNEKSLGAEDGGTEDLIAYSFSYLVEDELHILNVAVSPEAQGGGLGYILLNEVIELAVQKGARTAFLEVRRSNLAAINLYLKAGFRETSYRKNYYSDNQEDAILMEKEL